MAAMDFPNSPTVGQEYTVGGRIWRWSGEKWLIVNSAFGVSILDNIGDVSAPVPSSGDFLKWNGSAWINDPINLGSDTAGNYLVDLSGGTGVTITHTPGEGSTATVAIGQSVATSASVQFAALSTTGDLTVGGNLLVSGSSVTLNTETLLIEDNILTLNSGVTGSPALNAGIEVERGDSTNVEIRWNETTDTWQFTNDGAVYEDFGTGVGGAEVSASAPAAPEEGGLWFDSTTTKTYVYYDSSWIEIGAASGIVANNIDGGEPDSVFGGGSFVDGGGVS